MQYRDVIFTVATVLTQFNTVFYFTYSSLISHCSDCMSQATIRELSLLQSRRAFPDNFLDWKWTDREAVWANSNVVMKDSYDRFYCVRIESGASTWNAHRGLFT